MTESEALSIEALLSGIAEEPVEEWKNWLGEIEDENIRRVVRTSLKIIYRERNKK